MTRTYAREAKHYDRAVLTHLVETGQAQYYPAQGGIYVIKIEDGTVAVRQHQIIDRPVPVVVTDVVEVRVPSPMDGYSGKECYDGEDTGPGGVVYDSMLALAEQWVALCSTDKDADPLMVVRQMLDDYEGEVEQAVREQIAGATAPARRVRRSGLTAAEEQELLQHFM